MYKIVFSDRTQVQVDDEQGKKLMELQASVKRPDYVNISDSQYRMSSITKVIKVPNEPQPARLLTSGMVKRHEKSIHREIFYLYKKELLKENPRTWDIFRQKAYDYLYTKSLLWCDDRKGTCACEDKKEPVMPPSTGDVKAIMEYMRA